MHMNRYKAFGVHLSISAVIVGIFLLLTFFVWYPSPLFRVEGTFLPLQFLVGVDVVLGPVLTLIIFKPGKKGLKLDLTLIAIVQLSAFIYGASVIYTERPAFVAFGVDRFTVIPQSALLPSDMSKLDPGKVKINTVGPTWVYAEKPKDPIILKQMIFDVAQGKPSFDKRPDFYRNLRDNIANNYSNTMDLVKYGEKVKAAKPLIEAFLKKQDTSYEKIVAYPLTGKHHDMVIVLDRDTTAILGGIDIDPWINI